MKNYNLLIAVFVLMIIVQSCSTQYFRKNYTDVLELIHQPNTTSTKPYLKAHYKNGDVCILKDNWNIDSPFNILKGYGVKYDYNRNKIYEGEISVIIDSISIFETNTKLKRPEAGRIAVLSILTGLEVSLGIECANNPKSCFGSCPTFYINEKDNFHYADAEGFSNAILPSMEYADIDALNCHHIDSGKFSLTLKNEALETHCINDIKLIAFPVSDKNRIYQTKNNQFFYCENSYPLTKAYANEGEITSQLKFQDRNERFSLSENKNLSSKEEIILNFDLVKDTIDLGLILNYRQTLMSTYFIYHALGYMGNEVGDILANFENNKKSKLNNQTNNGIKKELGNIEIYLWNKNLQKWEFQDGLYETGPIAINRQIIPLKKIDKDSDVKIKLVLNKGLWRIDYAALTNIKKSLNPIEISPTSIFKNKAIDSNALKQLIAPDQYLVTFPGEQYTLNFKLPDSNNQYELFLYSKGYYIEWMRQNWLQDKNLYKLNQMINHPKKYLRVESKSYKKYEMKMEQEFWNSKIDSKTFSYDEK